jgi:galactonate dehydratase
MKVNSVRTFLVDPGAHKRWLFVKLETDNGLYGWGECYTQLDRDRAIEVHVQELGRYLIDRSPFDIKHFTYVAYTDFATKRGAMDLYCAISGLEQAFEDLGRAIARAPLPVEESYVTLPTAPGLGIDLDEDEVAHHPYRARSLRPLRRPRDE